MSETVPTKCTVIALYDYVALDTDELSFHKDDVLEILGDDDEDEGWWKARKGEDIGIIPSNYVFVSTSRAQMQAETNGVSPQRPSASKTTAKFGDTGRKLNYAEITNSAELSRLKELRREAENRIIALRYQCRKAVYCLYKSI